MKSLCGATFGLILLWLVCVFCLPGCVTRSTYSYKTTISYHRGRKDAINDIRKLFEQKMTREEISYLVDGMDANEDMWYLWNANSWSKR